MVDDLLCLQVDGDHALDVQLHLARKQVTGHASLRVDDIVLVVHNLYLHRRKAMGPSRLMTEC